MALGIEFACFVLFCQGNQPKGSASYIGSSGCLEELRSDVAEFGLALDRKQNVFAEVRKIHGKPTLLVVQYADKHDGCGTVKDIVIAPNSRDVFEFECIDNEHPKRVVIGVRPEASQARRWKASRAWIVDFEKLELLPTDDSVSCINSNYAGTDDGSDVRSRAVERAKKKSP